MLVSGTCKGSQFTATLVTARQLAILKVKGILKFADVL